MFIPFFYDPLTLIAMFMAYFIGYVALLFIAAKIAPRAASRLSNKFSLYTSMFLAGILVVVGGVSAIYVIAYILVYVLNLPLAYLAFIVFFAIAMNILSYIMAPYMINAMYGARGDEELQRIVDEVSRRAGFDKPPRAVVVDGPPNAFAYGNFLTGRYVAVTTGMLQLVSREELEAVIGHELGHHKHRDMVVLLLMGILPSILYYLGLTMIRMGVLGGLSSSRERRGEGGLIFLAIGVAAIVVTVILQILIFAFSRLREYYADAHGAVVASVRNMQRSLAKLHVYYSSVEEHREAIDNSKLRTLFIYALLEAVANPYISYHRRHWRIHGDVDHLIERLKRQKVNPVAEIMSTHPPIPKRLAFLDTLEHLGKN